MAFSCVTVWSSCQREGIGANRHMARSFWGTAFKISAILRSIPWVGGMLLKPCAISHFKIFILLDGPVLFLTRLWSYISALQRAGAEFPKRSEKPAPLFNGQSQAARNMRSPDQQDEAESSTANDFPALRCALLPLFFIFFDGRSFSISLLLIHVIATIIISY